MKSTQAPSILSKPSVFLAPMEGVTDFPMREVLTAFGGIDICVSEFIRVSNTPVPGHVFKRDVPELPLALTASGKPVVVQILGGDSERVAQSALNAVTSGAKHIDLNFGCPAPTVNKNDGGASLLKDPPRLQKIIETTRRSLPPSITLSAKLRLGWDDANAIEENAERAIQGGIDWLTIHARTRMQGYQPPVFWEHIGRINKNSPIPVVANGDIWTLEDFNRCREMTECKHFMLGRPLLADPALGLKILNLLRDEPMPSELDFSEKGKSWLPLFISFSQTCRKHTGNGSYNPYLLPRLKQWCRYAIQKNGFEHWEPLKRAQNWEEFLLIGQKIWGEAF